MPLPPGPLASVGQPPSSAGAPAAALLGTGPGATNGRAAGARRAARAPLTPERLREFFAPRSVALVGASDTSGWARFIVAASDAARFPGPLLPVHPRHQTVFGKPAVRSLRDLAELADLAFILVPTHAVEEVIEDAAAAGVRNAIVLASGYREVGPEGRVLEDRLVARAAGHGIVLLGPNCLGFLNAHAGAGPFALTVPLPLLPGPVGIALQSGALASVVLAFAKSRAIGVSTLATMGNESMISTTDVLDYLVDDENTKVICLFLEEISDPEHFARAAARADRAGKPIVALKAGSSPAGQQAALAHTGSVAGDDAVVDAVLRQLNVIRVTSLEELLCTAALLGYDRWPRGRRMGVLTASGGACDIIADRASEQGIQIPEFAAETAAAITPHLPPFAAARNPLDVTGYGLANQRTTVLTAIDHALDAALADPGLDFVLFSGINIPDVRPPDEALASMVEQRVAWLGDRIASAPIPVIPVGSTCVDVTGFGRELLTRHQIHVLGGIDLGVQALGNALRWLDHRGQVRTAARPVVPSPRPATDGPWSESGARDLLGAAGVPLVPAELVSSADAAAEAARWIGGPVVLKVCSAQITHKSDIGGVALGVHGDGQVRAAYRRVRDAGQRVPGATVDGVLVMPMRGTGVELLAGVTGDQLGLQGMAIPEEYGGAGFSFAEQAIVLEELGAALYGGPYLASAVLAAAALLASPDEGARRDLLPGIASGETVATLAFTEDDGSWEPGSIRLAAAKNGGGWRLDGHKSFVLDGHTAGLILAVATTDAGLALFAVDAAAPGLARAALPTLDQTRKLARLEFSSVAARPLGAPGDARAILDHTLDVAAVALAAEQLGGAQRALDMAVEYARIRHQFGRPIGSFQAIKHRCADLLLEVESLRSAVAYAAAAVAERSPEVPVVASLIKAYASETYFHVAAENIQIHGGIGFTWEHDAHLYFKRAKSSELFLGDGSYHRERLVTRIGL